jgi:phytoene dehydrogenase-like protein
MEKQDVPEEFRLSVEGIKMAGPCAKVNMALSEEPRFTGMPADADPNRRSLATLVPTLEGAERMYDVAKWGEIPEDLWVDCVVASNVDPSLAPEGKHVMTCFVQYVPYELRSGTWEENRDLLGRRVVEKVGRYAPNVPGAIEAMKVVTPLDLEQTYGLTEGNIFHGDLNIEQLFFMRPVPGWTKYQTPVRSLYLCGAGTHPGGGVQHWAMRALSASTSLTVMWASAAVVAISELSASVSGLAAGAGSAANANAPRKTRARPTLTRATGFMGEEVLVQSC